MTKARNSKHQHPSSREAPTSNIQVPFGRTNLQMAIAELELGAWIFSGAWMLVLGAFGCVHGLSNTFISPGSFRYSRSNQLAPSDNGAAAEMRGSAFSSPRPSISRQAGYSPRDAQDP